MTASRAAIAAVVLAVSTAPAAANPDFDRGKELLENLEYRAAAEAFEKALAAGGNDAATAAAIHLHLGEIAAATGDTGEAVDHFKRALSIDLTLKLPKGTSPKVGKPFADARRGIDDPISAKIAVDSGETVAAMLEISGDSLKMITTASVTYIAGDERTSADLKVRGARTPIPLPAGATGLEIALLDRHGNRLVSLEPVSLEKETESTGETTEPVITEPAARVSEKASRPLLTRWYLYGGLAVAAAGAGVGFGLASRSAINELDELKMNSMMVEGSEALAVEDKARKRALYANISFAAAGAFAIAGAVFFFTGGDDEPSEPAVSLTPAVGPERIGVVSTVRW